MEVSAVALQQATARANVSLSALKNNADVQKQLANVIQQTVEAGAEVANNGRGGKVDLFA